MQISRAHRAMLAGLDHQDRLWDEEREAVAEEWANRCRVGAVALST